MKHSNPSKKEPKQPQQDPKSPTLHPNQPPEESNPLIANLSGLIGKSRFHSKCAVHWTHEAAQKIAGIGAVLDGFLTEEAYHLIFGKTLLAGAYHFPKAGSVLDNARSFKAIFDSATRGAATSDQLRPETVTRLQAIADDFGGRIVFGERLIGQGSGAVWVPVILASPDGMKREHLERFEESVRATHGFDLSHYLRYPAIAPGADRSLERILRGDSSIVSTADKPITDRDGNPLYGGIPFVEGRAVFPEIPSLDDFSRFPRANGYLVELEFYFYSAPILFEATRCILETEWQLSLDEATFFSHDWIAIPTYWAMQAHIAEQKPAKHPKTLYFAHEARIARLVCEGVIRDALLDRISPIMHPDGHDAGWYSLLKNSQAQTLDELFPPIEQPGALHSAVPGSGPSFHDIFYHSLNCAAGDHDAILCVGANVAQETKLIVGKQAARKVALVPNGIPNLAAGKDFSEITEAQKRLGELCAANCGFTPDFVFTTVGRNEMSKGPWRLEGFLRTFARVAAPKKAVLLWLARPKPLPQPAEIEKWSAAGWPLTHRAKEKGGDLRPDEVPLWEAIERFNRDSAGSLQMLYVNQFGFSPEKLGALKLCDATFLDLRLGTDAEFAFSVYEPFGIAPLEALSSGAVCAVSDACGCAIHLEQIRHEIKQNTRSGNSRSERDELLDELAECQDDFAATSVIGRFTQHHIDPQDIDLEELGKIEAATYQAMAAELLVKLAVPRAKRWKAAQVAMPLLSWRAAVRYHLIPALEAM